MDTRHKNANWNVGERPSLEYATLAVLMDVRDELQALNRVFTCWRFQSIPDTLKQIDKRLARRMPLRQKNREPKP